MFLLRSLPVYAILEVNAYTPLLVMRKYGYNGFITTDNNAAPTMVQELGQISQASHLLFIYLGSYRQTR